MKTEKETYNTIKWDPRFNELQFSIEYRDKEVSYKKVPFGQYSPNGDVPWHRIVRFYYRNNLVWDRENKIEILDEIHSMEDFQDDDMGEISSSDLNISYGKGYFFDPEINNWANIASFTGHYSAKNQLTVQTFNVLCDTYEPEKGYANLRYPEIIKFIKNRSDIIHLQEVTTEFAGMLLSEKWVRENYFVSDTEESLWKPFGVLTLSRFPFFRTSYLSLRKDRRPILLTEIEIEGKSFLTVNVHLNSNRSGNVNGRKKEIDSLMSLISDSNVQNVILAGDFNFNDNSEALPITQKGFIDIDRYFFSDEKNNSFDPHINKLARLLSPMGTARRMDRIFLKSHFAAIVPSYFEVYKEIEFSTDHYLSDHFPVFSELDLNIWEEQSVIRDGFKGEISLEVMGTFPLALLETSSPSYFLKRIKDLILNSAAFEIVFIKQGNSHIISSSPQGKLEDLKALLHSCFPDSKTLNNNNKALVDKDDRSVTSIVSALKDPFGNLFPTDFLCLESVKKEAENISEYKRDFKADEVISYFTEKYGLKLIGSYLLGAEVPSSDIDFFSSEKLEDLSEELKKEFEIRSVGKRVKSLKFDYKGFEIDIQFEKEAYNFNKLMESNFNKNPSKQNLLFAVKLWAEKRGLNKQAHGYLSGSAWALSVNDLERANLNLIGFFEIFNSDILPPSYREHMSLSSKTVLKYEINRAKELIRTGNQKRIFDKKTFRNTNFISLDLKKKQANVFLSSYLKLSRKVELAGGLIDVLRDRRYKVFIFGLSDPEKIIEKHLKREDIFL